jgi:hypothetical protein
MYAIEHSAIFLICRIQEKNIKHLQKLVVHISRFRNNQEFKSLLYRECFPLVSKTIVQTAP